MSGCWFRSEHVSNISLAGEGAAGNAAGLDGIAGGGWAKGAGGLSAGRGCVRRVRNLAHAASHLRRTQQRDKQLQPKFSLKTQVASTTTGSCQVIGSAWGREGAIRGSCRGLGVHVWPDRVQGGRSAQDVPQLPPDPGS